MLSHQNLIAENHADTLFRGYPGDNLPMQNAYFSSLQANGVRYTVGAHDHMHQRSIVTSPDGASRLQELIITAVSSKFYDPQPLSTANFQGQKVRETSVSQDLYRIGFYIFTIDGDQVTVDYYADDKGGWSSDACWPEAQTPVDCVDGGAQGSHVTPDLNFVKRESWGYDMADGTEYLFGGGAPNGTGAANATDYTAIHETFEGTQASVVAGTYPNTSVDANARPLVQVVDTGWTKAGSKGAEKGLASDAFRLWGMSPVGSPRNSDGGGMTATFTLTMSYDPGSTTSLGNGAFGLGTRTSAGTWVNAVDLNVGGTTTFVMGPWAPGYGLGSYGTDPSTKTVWAVVNHDGSFAAANDIEPVPGQVK